MKKRNLLLLLAAPILTSCIRDEIPPCPALSIKVTVKDKNYANVHKVEMEEAMDENLPFREYVPTLYYRLYPLGSDTPVAERKVYAVTGEEQEESLSFDSDLPYGTYVLTVWGGLKDQDAPDAEGNYTSVSLHPDGAEGEDIYLANDTLVFDMEHANHTVEMERTKGKLLVWAVNLPEAVCHSNQTCSDLSSRVDHRLVYSGSNDINTQHTWPSVNELLTKTLLAPSAQQSKGSVLKVDFEEVSARTTGFPIPEPVKITVRRNELAAVKYVYKKGGLDIYILVNDNWEKVHGMEID